MKSKTIVLLICIYLINVSYSISGAELMGRFVYNGQPVAGLSVFAISNGEEVSEFAFRAITNDQGEYNFSDLAEGEYRLRTFGSHSNDYYNTLHGYWGSNTGSFYVKEDGKYKLNDLSVVKEMKTIEPKNGTIMSTTDIIFKWESVYDASYFVVKLFNSLGEKVFESEPIYNDEYRYLDSLESGIYSWEVQGFNKKKHMIARTPFSKRRRLFSYGEVEQIPELEAIVMGKDYVNGDLISESYEFTTEDAKALVLINWGRVDGQHVLIYKFFDPSGDEYHELPFVINEQTKQSFAWIDIKDHRAEKLSGNWTVEVWLDSVKIETTSFNLR